MRILLVAFALMSLSILPAVGQTIVVRSGEHDDFTRLVLDMPAQATWTLEQGDRRAKIRFSERRFEIDVSKVFDRIPRARIIEVNKSDGAVELTLGCDCKVNAYWFGERMLVVDVSDSVEPDVALASVPEKETPDNSMPADAVPRFTQGQVSSLSADLVLNRVVGRQNQVQPQIVVPQPEKKVISQARAQLLEQLGRGASQGLLSIKERVPVNTQNEDVKPAKTEGATQPEQQEPEATDAGGNRTHIRVQTSIDREFLEGLHDVAETLGQTTCATKDAIDLDAWGGSGPFYDNLGQLRETLFGEFDRVDETAVLKLARFYIYSGFGAEALQVLRLSKAQNDSLDILRDMAQFLEYGPAQEPSALSRFLECDSTEALWAALSLDRLPEQASIQRNALLRNFNALPPHLRRDLGPDLARKLIQSGRLDTGEKILRILERNTDTVTVEAKIIEDQIAPPAEEVKEPQQALGLSQTLETGQSPEALFELVHKKLIDGAEVSYETAQLAGAYAQELQDLPLGRKLAGAYVQALASSGAFDESLAELKRLQDGIAAPGDAVSGLYSYLVQNADEVTFLRFATSIPPDFRADLNPEVADKMARRLIDAGFFDQAAAFVEGPSARISTRRRAILRAEVSLGTNKPRQAEVDLLGLTGKDINTLRARARNMLGEYDAAYQLYAGSEELENAGHAAWMSENWDGAQDAEDGALASFAEWMAESQSGEDSIANAQESAAGELARDYDLVKDSSSTRKALEDLLAAKPLPDPGGL